MDEGGDTEEGTSPTRGAEAGPPLRPVAPDRYSGFRVVGAGGMGVVYRALDTDLHREVAFKVVRPEAGGKDAPSGPAELSPPPPGTPGSASFETLKARFLQEAWVTAGLEHPGIVPVHELGRTAAGVPYYTMRFVRGSRTLRTAIEECRTIEERLALLDPYLRLCDTIRYAHAHGVVHRDLKPENVALGEFGEVVLLDWGLAKMADRSDAFGEAWQARVEEFRRAADLRTLATALGTPGFMAPEAALGRVAEVDASSDVYSLGAILYQTLTGKLPHAFSTYGEFLRDLLEKPPPDPSAVDPAVPPGLANLCVRALSREKSDRPRSVEELADLVRAWRRERAAELELEVLRREAAAARDATEGLDGDALLRQLDRAHAAAAKVLERRADDGAARAIVEDVARRREEGTLRRERTARRHAVRRAAAVGCAIAAVAAVAVAWVVRAEKEATKLALETAKSDRIAKDAALREEAAAQEARAKAVSRAAAARLLASSLSARRDDPARALALALAAHDLEPLLVSRNAVLEALVDLHEERSIRVLADDRPVPFRSLAPVFDATGLRVAAALQDGSIRVWDARTGEQVLRLEGHPDGAISALVWTPDGARIVSADTQGTLRTWDGTTGARVRELRCPGSAWSVGTDGSRAAAFSGAEVDESAGTGPRTDGAARAVRRTPPVRVFDVAIGEQVASLEVEGIGDISFVSLARDGSIALVAQMARLEAWDVRTAKVLWMKVALLSAYIEGAMTPDGKCALVTSSLQPGVLALDAASGARVQILGERTARRSMRFAVSPDGKRVAVGYRDVTVHSLPGGEQVARLAEADVEIETLTFTPDGTRLVTTGEDHVVTVWDAATGAVVAKLRGHTAGVERPAVSPDGTRIATVSADATLRLWSAGPHPEVGIAVRRADAIPLATFSPDGGRILAACADRSARVVDVATLRTLLDVAPPSTTGFGSSRDLGRPTALFLPGGTRFFASGVGSDAASRVFDAATGEVLAVSRDTFAHPSWLSPDGSRAFECTFFGVRRILDVAGGFGATNVRTAPNPGGAPAVNLGEVRDAAFTRDGSRLAVLYSRGTIVAFDPATGREQFRLVPPPATSGAPPVAEQNFVAYGALVLSPDGSRVFASAGGHRVIASEFREGATPVAWPTDGADSRLAISPDGRRLFVGAVLGKSSVRDSADGRVLCEIGESKCRTGGFGPDGRLLATGSADAAVRLFDAATGEEVLTCTGHRTEVLSVQFSPDGRLLLSASEDGTVRLWPTDVIAVARSRCPRQIDAAERAALGLDAPPR